MIQCFGHGIRRKKYRTMMLSTLPGRHVIGHSKRGEKKRTTRSVSVTALIRIVVAAAALVTLAAHYAFVQRGDANRGATGTDDVSHLDILSSKSIDNDQRMVGRVSDGSANNSGRSMASSSHNDATKYHIVFSTDCSPYQHWQSYVLFYSALKVGQPGYITRIASGCSGEEGKAEMDWHDKHIRERMSDKFRLHLTPHFSSVKKGEEVVGDYEFFNKPFGLRHWMENGEGMGLDPNTGTMKDEDIIVILLDPDQILLRPFENDFSNDEEVVITGVHKENRRFKVEHGTPFGQLYGLGNHWQQFNLDVIAGEDSPAKRVTPHDSLRDYPAGPPYLGTARDMYQIAVKWTETAPKVHAEYPYLLAEMYAYCIAAADRGLPHQIVGSLMVSDTAMSGEGWKLVDKVAAEEICEYASNLDYRKHALPNVLHHCQRYMLGKHFFGKRRLPKDFFTCESPMLIDVPADIALKYDYRIPPPPHKPAGEKKPVNKKVAKRETFMLCALTAALNEAAEFFKRHACDGVEDTNYSKTMDLWQVPLI